MRTDARNYSTAPADLTPPGGPGLAPAEGGLPVVVSSDGNPVLAVGDDFVGNGYTAAPSDSGDPDTTVDSSSDQGANGLFAVRGE